MQIDKDRCEICLCFKPTPVGDHGDCRRFPPNTGAIKVSPHNWCFEFHLNEHKLKELIELHKYEHIKWIVRVHSDIGFLSCESQALQLLNGYMGLHKPNLVLSLNSEKFVQALSTALPNQI